MIPVSVLNAALRQVTTIAVALAGIAIISFFAARLLPGNPAVAAAGKGASAAAIAAVSKRLGLDEPLPVQFVRYVDDLAHFNLGTSTQTEQPVAREIWQRLPATLELVIYSVLLYLLLSFAIGIITARHNGRLTATVIRLVALLGSSIPPYWLALVLQYVFYFKLGWLPSGGRLPVTIAPPKNITGLYTLDSLLTGNWTTLRVSFEYLVLPVVSLTLVNIGYMMRLVRSQVLATAESDFVLTAATRGLSDRYLMRRHILPNAVNPVITIVGMQVGFLLGGTIFIETVFSWPGLGLYVYDAINNSDYPAICGVAITMGLIFLVISTLVDIAYRINDPRIRQR